MNWNTSIIDANGIELCVHRAGALGSPVIVLVHGFSDDGRCWGAFAERVADRFDIVAVDARNHGGSGRGAADAGLLADDLAAVIRSLGGPAPMLIGHSIGASTVANTAASWPDLADRIVLEDPPWRLTTAEDGELATRRDAAARWIGSLADLAVDQLIELGQRQHPTWTDDEIIPWAQAKQRLDEMAVHHLQPFDWIAVVPKIACPTLVVQGDPARDSIATPQLVNRILELNANVRVGKVDGAGHNIRRDALAGYLGVVVPFIEGPSSARG